MTRDRIDLLASRMDLLKGKDKALMTMYLQNGNSFRQMARLMGINEATISRRIHKVTKRLLDGEYITCLRNSKSFSRAEINISRDYFVGGLSMRKIAAKNNCSYYQVRKTLKKIQNLVSNI